MDVENICIAFHFADKFASVDCVSEMRFISACYRQNVAYVPEISIFQLRQTHNELGAFPRR